jgi:hypothetical protein
MFFEDKCASERVGVRVCGMAYNIVSFCMEPLCEMGADEPRTTPNANFHLLAFFHCKVSGKGTIISYECVL